MELLLKSGEQTTTKQPLILAVDDDEDNLMLLAEVLKPFNCSFIVASNGEAALTLAQNYQPDLVLLDVMLPDLSGIEVIQKLRQNPQICAIPVIAVTALATTEDRDRLLLAGCNGYLSKPYMLEELEALIGFHLHQVPAVA